MSGGWQVRLVNERRRAVHGADHTRASRGEEADATGNGWEIGAGEDARTLSVAESAAPAATSTSATSR